MDFKKGDIINTHFPMYYLLSNVNRIYISVDMLNLYDYSVFHGSIFKSDDLLTLIFREEKLGEKCEE